MAALVGVAGAVPATSQEVVLPPGMGAPQGTGTRPSPAYDLGRQALAAGEFTRALEVATAEYQGCMQFGGQRWIDSIAAAGLVAEAHVALGNFPAAVAAAEEALTLATVHPDWLLAVQFPPQPLAALPAADLWARSRRGTVPANVPQTVAIRQGGANPRDVLQKGGILTAAYDQSIRAQEIMRALVVATYRLGDLLGPLARDNTALDGAAKVLARRPAPPAHYAQSWIDVALGMAFFAQGRPEQALPLLDRGLVVGRGLDHPLTPWGLIALGRIALDADQAARAAPLFEEAALAAGTFGDEAALEEAFRLALAAHMAAGTRGPPPAIRAASEWAADPRLGLPLLRARLLAMQAECLAAAGDVRNAAAALGEIDARLVRGEAGRGALGAEAAYAAAVREYATGDVAKGDADIGRALGIARGRSPALYQTTVLTAALAAGASVADRRADELFTRLLSPPQPREFAVDPLGTLAAVTTARHDAFETWLAVQLRRHGERATDALLDTAEAAARDRWSWAQPLGGRRLAAERLLAADPGSLPAAVAARRAALLGGRRDLGPLLERMTALRAALAAAVQAAPEPAPRGPPGAAEWKEYRSLNRQRAAFGAALAAGREPVTIDFPPLTPAVEIRRRLAPGQLVLSFHWTTRGLLGALESRDRFVVWEVRQAAGIPAELKSLARGLCLFGGQAAVGTDRLLESDWRSSATRLERMLFENSKVELAKGIDELVIVPDGWLWYLPFEILPVSSNQPAAAAEPPRLLRDACRIRYCPTRSLAVSSLPPAPANGPLGIHAGRMAAADKPADVAAVVARVTAAVDRAVPLPLAPGNALPAALVASVFDGLAVFDEVASGEGPIAARPLVPAASGRGGLSFADWLEPPLKRPWIIVAPGMDTPLVGGFDKAALPTRPGDDLFVAALDLLAAGARTAVVSRWRVGGGTCVDVMTEFLRDATAPTGDEPRPPASESWRRAVDLVTAERPDPDREPRLRFDPAAALPDARHPFLWAGPLLVDCGSGQVSEPAPPAAVAPQPAAPAPAPAMQPAPPAAVGPAPGAPR
jgi:hypothetical protein